MRSEGKYCKNCKKYKNKEELNTLKIPSHCSLYEVKQCRKIKRISKYLQDYFPYFNVDPHLYENIELSLVSTQQLLDPLEVLKYFSIRVPTFSKEKIVKYKKFWKDETDREIWRCKTEEEAINVVYVLNQFKFYWVPIEVEGGIYYEEVVL